MKAIVTDAEICTPADLFALLSTVDDVGFIGALSTVAAALERTSDDGPLYNRLAAAILAEAFVASAGHAALEGEADRTLERLFRCANGIPSRNPGELANAELTEHNCRMVLRMGAQHEAYLGPLKPALARAEILFGRLLPASLCGRSDPLTALPTATGATYQEARALFLGTYGWVTAATVGSGPRFLTPHTLSTTSDGRRFWDVANAYAGDRAALSERRATDPGYGFKDPQDFRYSFSILRDVPFLRMGDGALAVPVARHLGLALADGIYDFLSSHYASKNQGKEFDEIFGDVTDAYVRERFRRELGDGGYLPLRELGDGQLSPDGLSGDDCVLELKGKRLLRGIITTGVLGAAPYFIGGKRGLGRGVAQLLSELDRTRRGQGRGLDRAKADHAVLCLVTPDGLPGFHLGPVRNWVLRAFSTTIEKDFPELRGELKALARFHWLSFDELDRICRAARIAGCSVGRLLQRFRLETEGKPAFDTQTNRFQPSLRSWLLTRYPASNDDPWFDEAFGEAWRDSTRRLLGVEIKLEV